MCHLYKVAVLKSRYNFSDAIIDNVRLIIQILYADKMFYIKGGQRVSRDHDGFTSAMVIESGYNV